MKQQRLRILSIVVVTLVVAGGEKSAARGRRTLAGREAVHFLQETGIYHQIAAETGSFPSAGREFFSTGQIGAVDGSTGDDFGIAVARHGDTVLIGATGADIDGSADLGAAYVFTDVGGDIGWALQARLTADDGATGDGFGFAVALEGDTALIGAPQADPDGNMEQGAVYLFTREGVFWSQTQKLAAGAGSAGDEFGYAVALYEDTALVGAPGDDIDGAVDQGAAYVFTGSGGVWNQRAQLVTGDTNAGDRFGFAVALSGDTALVGAPYEGIGFADAQGVAYVFTGSGGSWSQQARLVTADGGADDRLGGAVALDGNTALVGAHLADVDGTNNQGAAYVFTRDSGSWSLAQKLVAADGAQGDRLGRSVAVAGDTLLVGAPRADVGGHGDQGAAYVFIREGGSWRQQNKLASWEHGEAGDRYGRSVALAGDAALVGAIDAEPSFGHPDRGAVYPYARGQVPWLADGQAVAEDGAEDDEFGYAVAVDGDRALVGALAAAGADVEDAGAAYVFEYSAGGWVQVDKLVADGGQDGSHFGYAVALDGHTALVGAPRTDAYGTESRGLAYVFVHDGDSWIQQAILVATSGSTNDLFASSVALDGDTALVGAPNANPSGQDEQGAAYLFKRESGNWPQRGFLISPDGEDGDGFGAAVALLNGTALVGAPNASIDGNPLQGAVYVFALEGTIWSQQAKLTAADGDKLDVFGNAVAINGTMAAVGAFGKEALSGSDSQGAVYLFTRSGDSWSQHARLIAADGVAGDLFGYAVSLDGNKVLIGAPLAHIDGIGNRGAAYLFTEDGGGWRQQAKLTAANGAENDSFGAAVALGGVTALVGTPVIEIGGNSYQGQIFFFRRPPYERFLPAVLRSSQALFGG